MCETTRVETRPGTQLARAQQIPVATTGSLLQTIATHTRVTEVDLCITMCRLTGRKNQLAIYMTETFHGVMQSILEKFAPESSSAENRQVMWGPLDNKSPPHQVILLDEVRWQISVSQCTMRPDSITHLIPKTFFCVINVCVIGPDKKNNSQTIFVCNCLEFGTFVCNWTGEIFCEAKKF